MLHAGQPAMAMPPDVIGPCHPQALVHGPHAVLVGCHRASCTPDALQSKSVPQDERMFAHADGVTTVVTMFKYGRGSVFYLGYDWFQSAVITFYTVLASTGSVATADHDGLHGES